ncbi:transmembrane protease serine 9-like [Chanos chanos]|uniref:Transmembrane protease serine 9-like n=1 Tax=Chanos chanos TaxID=29144 RepID=A0A6J2WZP9_CHACN|nr:transmembrane protease serine 9-like [Chanos chanos]
MGNGVGPMSVLQAVEQSAALVVVQAVAQVAALAGVQAVVQAAALVVAQAAALVVAQVAALAGVQAVAQAAALAGVQAVAHVRPGPTKHQNSGGPGHPCWCLALAATQVTIYLGRQSQQGSNPNEVSRSVSQIIIHPDYISITFNNDIALLRLSSSVNFTDYIRPVCLAAADSTFYNGTDSWITGFNRTSQTLQEEQMSVMRNRQCRCIYGANYFNIITEQFICARSNGSCVYDTGAPMVSKQGSRWIQSGIFLGTFSCPTFPSVYTRVSQYQTWINSQITNDQPSFVSFTSNVTAGDSSVSCNTVPPITTATTASTTPTATTVSPVVCGSASLNTLRVGGSSSLATGGLWPWMASLHHGGKHVCGGTLITEQFVLSSADCFSSFTNASEWTVFLGRLNQNGSNPNEVSLRVNSITLSNLTGNNVAVLELASKPTFSDFIQPICVDLGTETFSTGTQCWIVGWGSGQGGVQQTLQEVQTTVVDCGSSASPENICTGFVTLQQGDDGGPLMCKQGLAWFQPAVLTVVNSPSSSSSRRNNTSGFMVFNRLVRYKSFLRKAVNSLPSPAFDNSSSVSRVSNSTVSPTTAAVSPTTATVLDLTMYQSPKGALLSTQEQKQRRCMDLHN